MDRATKWMATVTAMMAALLAADVQAGVMAVGTSAGTVQFYDTALPGGSTNGTLLGSFDGSQASGSLTAMDFDPTTGNLYVAYSSSAAQQVIAYQRGADWSTWTPIAGATLDDTADDIEVVNGSKVFVSWEVGTAADSRLGIWDGTNNAAITTAVTTGNSNRGGSRGLAQDDNGDIWNAPGRVRQAANGYLRLWHYDVETDDTTLYQYGADDGMLGKVASDSSAGAAYFNGNIYYLRGGNNKTYAVIDASDPANVDPEVTITGGGTWSWRDIEFDDEGNMYLVTASRGGNVTPPAGSTGGQVFRFEWDAENQVHILTSLTSSNYDDSFVPEFNGESPVALAFFVPEPGTAGLLIVGAAGLLTRRRRR